MELTLDDAKCDTTHAPRFSLLILGVYWYSSLGEAILYVVVQFAVLGFV